MDVVRPTIAVLSPEQTHKIHRFSIQILTTIGIRVTSSAALDLFTGARCPVSEDRQVIIPEDLVDWAVSSAPSAIDIYDRTGNAVFALGRPPSNPTRFGIGVTNLYYQDPETDTVESFSRDHLRAAVRLGNALESFDLVSTPGILQDVAPDRADLIATLEMVANTTKPLVLLISQPALFEPALELLAELHGDLAERPFILPYLNPITPLVINDDTVTKLLAAIRLRLPVVYNSYGMAGATTPISPGGTLALLNAELLAGLVLTQLAREGAPIILGSLPAGFDMKKSMGLYTPHTMLLNLACAEMMAFYDLPHSGTSGSGPGWGPDLPAAGAFWMNHLTGCIGKVGLAPFVGGNFDSLVFSPAAVVYADEVIRQARQFAAGFAIDERSVRLDEMAEVGSAGHYLGTELTAERFRSLGYDSRIWPNLPLDQWQAKGSVPADRILRERTLELLETAEAPGDSEELLDRGEAFLARTLGTRKQPAR